MRSPAAAVCDPRNTQLGLGPAPGYIPYDIPRLADRITVLEGADLTELEVDVIVRCTDNSLSSDDAVYRAVSTQLQQHLLKHVYDRRAGSVVVTPGFSLPCQYILHVVVAQRTGNATRDDLHMHQAYRGAVKKAVELGAESVAMGLHEVSRHRSQLDDALRILLCSVRSELVRNPELSVILATPPGVEPQPFPPCSCVHQFPTSEQDSKIDMKLGDRRIRIIHNPQSNDSSEDESTLYDEERGATAEAAAAMLASIDTQPLLAPNPRLPLARDDEDHLEAYERLLRRAQTEDLSSISGIGCLYQSGVDRLGRPVVIFIGKWFPFNNIDLEKAMLYLIKLLDPIVRGDYVIAYFHTMASAANNPPFGWLREVYSVLPYKYKKNLKAFYIVHPTFWTKMMTWWFTTFMAPAIKAKVHSLPGVEFLYSVMSRDQLEVPAFVTEYDMTINGLHYFQPDTNNT